MSNEPHDKIVIRLEELEINRIPASNEPTIPGFLPSSPSLNKQKFSISGELLQPLQEFRFWVFLAIAGIGVLAIVAIAFLAFNRISDPPAKAIERVFYTDKTLSEESIKTLPANALPAQLVHGIRIYRQRAFAQDFSGCPADFVVAYRHHIDAWEKMQAAVAQLPNGILDALFMGAFNALLRKEMDGGIGRLEGKLANAHDKVRSTWEEVERIGAKYGVSVRH